jgi:arylsulfatase A-like enzyme
MRPLRPVLAALLVLSATALLMPVAPGAQDERRRRPNVVVLMTDDQTLASLSVMGNVRRLLGGRGTTFERSFVSLSLCCPSRATFLTGQYAHNHGVLGNKPPEGGYDKLDTREWLPTWLQRAGYRTAHIGKFLNGYDASDGVPPGWNEWYGSVDPSTYRFYGYTLNENGRLVTYGADRNPAFYSTDFFARRASELITRVAPDPQPFFLSVAFLAPHSGGPRDPGDPRGLPTPSPAPRHRDRFAATPLPQPPSFNETDVSDKPLAIRTRPPIGAMRANAIQENHRQRLESLLSVDEAVASIMDTLRATGELDDTLVVFTSDNGFFHGEHRVASGKVLAYEPSIRVPLLMRGPGVPAGARRRQLVTNADLAPTILDAAQARPAGRPQDGRSLFPLLRDGGREWGRDLLIEGVGTSFDAVRTLRYKLVQHASGEQELYDLRRDPHELQSLHADPRLAAVKGQLAARLSKLKDCSGRGCRAHPKPRLRVTRSGNTCLARVGSRRVELVEFRSRRFVRDERAPFRARVAGPRLRVRVTTDTGSALTLDRRLPRACR